MECRFRATGLLWEEPDSNVHGANMGPIWGLQDPVGPHGGRMNLAIWGSVRLPVAFPISSLNGR